ncbi:MAG: hypothetical protein IJU48_00745 [Synergistaceae bacterium]|nr:hypothetical protein [Synergistaceae bacterium]
MSNDKQYWIVEDPWTGEKFYFDDERYGAWFRECLITPPMNQGSQPLDGGNFLLTEEEAREAVNRESNIAKFIRQCYGSREFINNIARFCLWLVDAEPEDIKHSKFIYDRVQKVKEFRLSCKSESTQKISDKPYLFGANRQPSKKYLLIPRHSSSKRRYVPMGYLPPEIIATDACFVLPNCTLYHFGVLNSSVHMGWMRRVCGRIRDDYRYSNTVVYNPFVWPNITPKGAIEITATAAEILEARENHPHSSLADLYDENTMPVDLRKAHKKNDEAVMKAYNFPLSWTEEEVVERMLDLYVEAREKYFRMHPEKIRR